MYDLSIIIPVFNAEKTIYLAINSILTQTNISKYKLEIIIIDDGSTDSTINVVKTINDDRIKIISQANGGVSSARNIGIENAIGEYIAFLDADDLWVHDKLEKQMTYLKEHPTIKLISSGRYTINDDKQNIHSTFKSNTQGNFSKKLFLGNFITTSSVILERGILEKDLFDTRLKFGEDWLFWLNLSIKHPFGYLTDPLVKYHFSDTTKYPFTEVEKCYKNALILYEKNYNKDKFYLKLEANFLLLLAIYNLKNGKKIKSLKYLKSSIRKNPVNIKGIIKFLVLSVKYAY